MQKTIYKNMFNTLLNTLQKRYGNDFVLSSVEIKNIVTDTFLVVHIIIPPANKNVFWQFLEQPITIIYKYNEDFNLEECTEDEYIQAKTIKPRTNFIKKYTLEYGEEEI